MATPTAEQLATHLATRDIAVDAAEAERLAAFLGLLAHWNRVHNLTGITDPLETLDRHLAESLALAPDLTGDRVADIGSGAGLPGIPLAIRLPDTHFTLIESRRKRTSFLRHVALTLGLGNVSVVHGRAEDLHAAQFTTVLARAVAEPARLLEIALPLTGPRGRLVLLTSADKGETLIRLAKGLGLVERRPATPATALKSRIVVLERGLS